MNKKIFWSLKDHIKDYFRNNSKYVLTIKNAKPGSKCVPVWLLEGNPEEFYKEFQQIKCEFHDGYLTRISPKLGIFSYSMIKRKVHKN